MTLLGGFLIASCACMLGFIVGGLCAGGKMQDLQDQIDLKREAWCGDCRFKADAKAFDELLLHERRSKYASLREKEKEIQALRVKLYEATRQMGIKQLSQQVAR